MFEHPFSAFCEFSSTFLKSVRPHIYETASQFLKAIKLVQYE